VPGLEVEPEASRSRSTWRFCGGPRQDTARDHASCSPLARAVRFQGALAYSPRSSRGGANVLRSLQLTRDRLGVPGASALLASKAAGPSSSLGLIVPLAV